MKVSGFGLSGKPDIIRSLDHSSIFTTQEFDFMIRSLFSFCLLAICTATLAEEGVRQVMKFSNEGPSLLKTDQFRAYEKGFEKLDDEVFVCFNDPADPVKRRGVSQFVPLNQKTPKPIIASAWSRAEDVDGNPDANYSIYLDLLYEDGTNLWGQAAPFKIGTTEWNRQQVVVYPDRPIRSLSFYTLFREHSGKAFFKDLQLREVEVPEGLAVLDGLPTLPAPRQSTPAFWIRDVAANGDFRDAARFPQDLEIQRKEVSGSLFEYTITSRTDKDRILTILYTLPVARQNLRYCDDPRTTIPVEPNREYMKTTTLKVGTNGRLSKYPFLAVAQGEKGTALGIDMKYPFFYRVGYNSGTEELFLAGDIALTKEKPSATIRICRFDFNGKHEFRGALAAYYELFPEAFQVRIPKQGVWMPFAKISEVEGWEDFGFAIKEGDNETAWDDEHGILTFRYTEPLTWWMSIPKELPRTMEVAMQEVDRLAGQGNRSAQALKSSGFRDEQGNRVGIFLDTPWTNGIVWSTNDLPNIPATPNTFSTKWNPTLFRNLYGPDKKADLDGEYIDSAECYVTANLDFDRGHFAASRHPLVFSQETLAPGLFKFLIVQEYIEAIEQDMRSVGKYMMANSTPHQCCWLVPLLDVLGTETNWNPGGTWGPLPDAELLYIRSLSGQKPFCFLMNTDFTKFSYELTEKFMKRSLAYGMFPGFFSADAATGHYFSQPALYNRDRPLFTKYVPLCKMVAEAGWEPITGATCDTPKVYLERFGNGAKQYLTVFNDTNEAKTVRITLGEPLVPQGEQADEIWEHVRLETIPVTNNSLTIRLGAEDVAVLEVSVP